MPLYEYRRNAANRIEVPAAWRDSVVVGSDPVYNFIKSIARYRKRFETDDPGFGWVNSEGTIEDLVDGEQLASLRARLQKTAPGAATIVMGPGADLKALDDLYDLRFYFDFTMQPMLWQMWDGELATFGRTTADKDYSWKRYYYCDFYLMYRQEKYAFTRMDYYVDAVQAENLKLVPRESYDGIVRALVQYPWNELAGIELSIFIDVGAKDTLNIPAQNIMQHLCRYTTIPTPTMSAGTSTSPSAGTRPATSWRPTRGRRPGGMGAPLPAVQQPGADPELAGLREAVGHPPGTSHGHGGNQMILEMDTEYSFFTFDYARSTWDDATKTMTGRRMRMHLDHSFANNRWRRENYVREHLLARPIVQSGDGDTRKDQYTTLPEMPFHIERLFLKDRIEDDAEGKFMHIATLAEGEEVTIRSG